MDNNQLLRALSHALEIAESDLAHIFALTGPAPTETEIAGWLGDSESSGFLACPDLTLRLFLEGLILNERGPRNDGADTAIEDVALSNNQILKKLRIAFNFQQDDMLSIFEEGGANLSSSEFSALFRKEGNKHFRPCSDTLLQSFLAGLTPSLDE